MGVFALHRKVVGKTARPAAPGTWAEPLAGLPADVPAAFEAVGEALVSEASPYDACAVAGRELALAGTSLDEALVGLEGTFRSVHGTAPTFAATRALAVAWSEATLGYLHQLGCADPVTGLASLAHLQSRLPELYRGELRGRPRPGESHALVVVDLRDAGADPGVGVGADLGADLRVARVAEAADTVFAGGEPVGRVARDTVVVLAERDEHLGRRVALLRTLLADLPGTRAWIEGLPGTDTAAAALLTELARG